MPCWPHRMSRWLEGYGFCRIFSAILWTEMNYRSIKMNIQPSWLNKLGQYGIYYIANRLQEWLVYFESWKESKLLEYNKNMIADYVFYVMTVFYCFLQLHCQHCPKIRNLDRPLHAIFFFWGGSKCTVQREQDKPILACLPGEADQNTGFTS